MVLEQNLESKKRLIWLDSLRGIAAIFVVILHNLLESVTFGYFDIGKIGGAIFFLISGFVIPISLYKKSIKQFIVGRFFRLYPAYGASILLAIKFSLVNNQL